MAVELPIWVKVLFLATNVPYIWVCFWLAVQPGFASNAALPSAAASVCRMSALYVAVLGAISLSSMLMHGAQMQFLCLCGCTRSCANRREPRHQPTWQMRFKRLDIGVALGLQPDENVGQGATAPPVASISPVRFCPRGKRCVRAHCAQLLRPPAGGSCTDASRVL